MNIGNIALKTTVTNRHIPEASVLQKTVCFKDEIKNSQEASRTTPCVSSVINDRECLYLLSEINTIHTILTMRQ